MQLHASHSTPSLETVAVTKHSSSNVAGSSHLAAGPSVSSHQQNAGSKAFANKAKNLAPGIDINANTAAIGFAPVATLANAESDQSRSSPHHVTSPSSPIIVTGTPNTPSFIPTDPLPHQGSHTLFSPHQPMHSPELLPHRIKASQNSDLRLSRASLSAPQDDQEAGDKPTLIDLPGRGLSSSEQGLQLGVSLGSSFIRICFSTALTLHHFFSCLECMLTIFAEDKQGSLRGKSKIVFLQGFFCSH